VVAGFEPVDILAGPAPLRDHAGRGTGRCGQSLQARGFRRRKTPGRVRHVRDLPARRRPVARHRPHPGKRADGARGVRRLRTPCASSAWSSRRSRPSRAAAAATSSRASSRPTAARSSARPALGRAVGPCMVSTEGSCAAYYKYKV
jgi:hypothetical protein